MNGEVYGLAECGQVRVLHDHTPLRGPTTNFLQSLMIQPTPGQPRLYLYGTLTENTIKKLF